MASLEDEYRRHITVTELCAAPAQGNTLLDFMLDTNDEALSFLTKFYYDRSGLMHACTDDKEKFIQQLLNCDQHFANDANYLF